MFGAISSYFGQREANLANARQASVQRTFQERMSSTAHQREVADLRAAGLNPILSAGGGPGASSPSGAMPNIRSNTEAGAASASALPRLMADLKQIKANTELTKAQIPGAESNSAIAQANAFSAENRLKVEAKYPKLFGRMDAILRRIGLGATHRGVRASTGGKH